MEHSPPQNGHAAVPPVHTPRAASLVPLAAGVVGVGALYLARDVLVPIVLAVLLAFVLAPLVGLFRRLRLGRTLSVVIAVLLALGTLGLTGAVIGQQVASLAPDVPRYAETIRGKWIALGHSSVAELPEAVNRLASRFETPPPTRPTPRLSRRAAQPIPVEVHQPPETGWVTARRLLGPVVGPLETFIIVLVVAVFILLQREDLRDRIIRLFGSSDLHRTTVAIDEAAARLSRYFLTQLLLNSLFGAVIALGLYWIGIPSPLLWGLLAAILRFVPYVGAFLAALPPLLLAIAAEPGWSYAIMTAGLFLAAEPIMGYVVEPLVYGHSTGLSPLAVIVAAIFWTWLWGPIGLLMSTPMTLCLVVLGRHVPQLEFIDVLFGDRPALTPVESFYQRMLAGDEHEVHDQAEQLLKERPLSSYYDEVVVGGLRLALADRRRGALTRGALDAIVESTRDLVDSLADHEDVEPDEDETGPADPPLDQRRLPSEPPPEPPARTGLTILCVAGAGMADPVIAAMLAQLLAKHGQRPVLCDATLATECDPVVVCLAGAAFRGSSPRWRSIEASARRRWPDARIVRGLLRDSRTDTEDTRASLRDMVETCARG
nr:AI-2E family transporter [Sphingomonas horti]